MIVLVAVAVAVYLGVAQRVLDRLRLSDGAALFFVGAMVVGGFLPDVPLSDNVAKYWWRHYSYCSGCVRCQAGTTGRKSRSACGTITTVVYAAMKVPVEPTYNYLLDRCIFSIMLRLLAIFPAVAPFIAIAGSMGLLLTDIYSRVEIAVRGGSGSMVIRGAGFDAVVVGGVLALLLGNFGEARAHTGGRKTGVLIPCEALPMRNSGKNCRKRGFTKQ